MMLCENRPEGFSMPHMMMNHRLPTTCFIDTIVVPLATWIYMVLLVIGVPLYYLSTRRGRQSTIVVAAESDSGLEEKHAHVSVPKKRSWIQRTLNVIYYLLIVAMLAMLSLEIARLSVAELGIGLIPFTYVGVLLAFSIHFKTAPTKSHATNYSGSGKSSMTTRWGARAINSLFWAMLLAAMAIKVAALVYEENHYGKRTGRQAKYPLSDSLTDVSTMVGVEFVLLILELVTA